MIRVIHSQSFRCRPQLFPCRSCVIPPTLLLNYIHPLQPHHFLLTPTLHFVSHQSKDRNRVGLLESPRCPQRKITCSDRINSLCLSSSHLQLGFFPITSHYLQPKQASHRGICAWDISLLLPRNRQKGFQVTTNNQSIESPCSLALGSLSITTHSYLPTVRLRP